MLTHYFFWKNIVRGTAERQVCPMFHVLLDADTAKRDSSTIRTADTQNRLWYKIADGVESTGEVDSVRTTA